MSQINELKREIQEAKKLRLSWRTKLFIFIVGAPTTFLFALYGRLEMVWPLAITVGMIGIVIRFKWKLRRQTWFWVTMALIAILHVLWVLFVPWTTKWIPVFVYIGIATADFVLILWILLVVEKFMGEPKDTEKQEDSL
ncbi:MAG: hypothetical protein WBE76_05665 [Terracidiphilus sp.]